MRKINKIIVHCSDSDNPTHDDISVIDQWHKQRGWKGVGYHYFIASDGEIQYGRELHEIGAHVRGHNRDSIGICLHGKTEFTHKQFQSLRTLLEAFDLTMNIADVYGHRDFDKNKTCPNFDVNHVI
ncbi:MAG: N-acetylmuramoyl-L-alanine amidase [Bacteroidales bacterium]